MAEVLGIILRGMMVLEDEFRVNLGGLARKHGRFVDNFERKSGFRIDIGDLARKEGVCY